MAKLPSFQFYPGDWQKDAGLRVCSIFARGLLIDLLCLMFDTVSRGKLCRPDGVTPWADGEIVDAVSGATRDEKLVALAELERNGVLKRDSLGILFSSRLIRDEELRQAKVAAGSKGGNKHQAARKQAASKLQADGEADLQAKPGSSSSASTSSSDDPCSAFAGDTKAGRSFPVRKARSKPQRTPNPLFDTIAEVTGLDPTTAGSSIGKVTASLAGAEPPYTVDDVHNFCRGFREFCPHAARDGRLRPTVNELEKYIGLLRAPPPFTQAPNWTYDTID